MGEGVSFIPYSRVQIGIKQVDEEVVEHNEGAKKQVDSRDHRVVSARERVHHQLPQPGQVEDVLDDHGPPDQDWQLQADQGHDRDERIFDSVSEHNEPLLEPLGPGGADIVLPQHFQHHGARHPHRGGRIVRPQNQTRDDEHPETAQRIFREGNHEHRGRPTPPDGREDHHHQGQPEIGRGQPDDGDAASQVVGGRILTHRRVDAHRQGDYQSDDDGHQPQLKGDGQSTDDLLLYRQMAAKQGFAQGTLQEKPADPAGILDRDRHIQPQHTLQRFTVYITRRVLQIRQHGVDHITWQQADREKDDDAQNQQGGDEQQYPPDDAHDDAGGAQAGLYPHRLVQGSQGAGGCRETRRQECLHPDRDHHRPPGADPGRRLRYYREHLQPAGARASLAECPQ